MTIPQFDLSWLSDPTVFAVNRLPAHSDHRFLVAGQEPRQSLDGRWRFHYSPSLAARPAEFWQPDADLSAFRSIRVPGHIETQGCGQIQYINTLYPWDGHRALTPPHFSPEDCAVGSYVLDFDLDPALRTGRVCLSFQGVERAFSCWCNGRFLGYSEDSFTPAEFDLTGCVRPTGNRLCVEVYQHCSASWLEDQDFFRFFGIFRPVYLYAKPDTHLEDVWLQAGLDRDGRTGTLAPRLKTSCADPACGEECTVRCTVTAPGGAVVHAGELALQPAAPDPACPGWMVWQAPELRLPDIRPWSHEDPALYDVSLTLLGADGRLIETCLCQAGFRRIEMADGLLQLNGGRLLFNGVNRHEWNPETGRAIGRADMVRAIETFRRNNINAVRTCHYPNQSLWYELCDQNGIYVIDETNMETHGTWARPGEGAAGAVPGSRPEWLACVLDRARSMLERDKNHPSVLLWSCGNESYAGDDILAMSRLFHELDPTRPVHYEGIFQSRREAANGAPYDPAWEATSDLESQMYTDPRDIRAYLESSPEKPIIQCEYMHDMGNSLGGMESYIALTEEFPQCQGGFIWDYMDQALWHTDPLGRRTLGYGGDFGERPTDYAFCANGIVFADGTEKPAMQEVRYWYDRPDRRARFDADNAAARIRSANALAAEAEARARADAAAPDLQIVQGDGNLGVRGPGFAVLFSYTEGGPVSLRRADGQEWLYRAPRPVFWRAATENDKGCGFPLRSGAWLAAEATARCTAHQLEECGPRGVTIAYTFTCPAVPGMAATLRYTVTPGGVLRLQASYQGAPGLPELPCFGVRLTTAAPADQVAWTGLSGETYPDRWKGGQFGHWQEAPHLAGYLVPQDCGCHVQTQAVTLRRPDGTELTACMAGDAFAFSALPHTALELEAADHKEDLGPAPHTHLCLYAAMRGVGGINTWGADVEPAYHVSGEVDHSLTVDLPLR